MYQACAVPWGPRGESQSVPIPKEHLVWWGGQTGRNNHIQVDLCYGGGSRGRYGRAEPGRADGPENVGGTELCLEGCVRLTSQRWRVGYSGRGWSLSKGWESGKYSVTFYHQAKKGVLVT